MSEETEPTSTEEETEEVNGVPGQIVYPDVEVDAERAAAYAAGKVDTLHPDDEDKDPVERIQEDLDNYPRDEEETTDEGEQ